jgi:pyruvate dehydrogenase E1 component alpha subunit
VNDSAPTQDLAPLPEESGLPPLDDDGLVELYREMRLLRRLEELAAKAYTQRKILGFCHLYIGQESVACGVAAVNKDDWWITAYRDHGHALAKGVSARAVMAELFGKETGCTSGQGGSMHLFSMEHRMLGGYGIVGGHVPLANGVGWAIRHRGEDRVCVCYFGDGAAHQGAFFEALCLAALYKLPVLFICENNGYAMGTAIHRQSALTDMSLRGAGVGMKHHRIEGFDVEVVREEVGRARRYIRAGNGPVILEIATYRHRGHSMSDPAKYRPEGELDKYKHESDPLVITRRKLIEERGVDEARLDAADEAVEAECQDAYDFADESAEPDVSTLYDFTYAPQTTGYGVGDDAPTHTLEDSKQEVG